MYHFRLIHRFSLKAAAKICAGLEKEQIWSRCFLKNCGRSPKTPKCSRSDPEVVSGCYREALPNIPKFFAVDFAIPRSWFPNRLLRTFVVLDNARLVCLVGFSGFFVVVALTSRWSLLGCFLVVRDTPKCFVVISLSLLGCRLLFLFCRIES